jgi:hypothetical protein
MTAVYPTTNGIPPIRQPATEGLAIDLQNFSSRDLSDPYPPVRGGV